MAKEMRHKTMIDGKPLFTTITVGENVADWLEVVKTEKKFTDEQADAYLCDLILDSVKLKQNAKVRGPYVKVLLDNRHAAEMYVVRDKTLGLQYIDAIQADRKDEFLDQILKDHWDHIHGVKPLPA